MTCYTQHIVNGGNIDILDDIKNSSDRLNYKQLMNLVLSSTKVLIFEDKILKLDDDDDIKHNEEHKTIIKHIVDNYVYYFETGENKGLIDNFNNRLNVSLIILII